MYKQTLCVTLPISAAVIIAAALFANAGELDPPKGMITPTMHTLEEIYNAVQASTPCGGCTWEHFFSVVAQSETKPVTSGTGIVHGIWLKGPKSSNIARVWVCNGPCDNTSDDLFGDFFMAANGSDYVYHNQFFELNAEFDQGLYVRALSSGGADVTVLYRSTNP